ncbi:MAG: hypothetical protein MO853_13760 [Candidatus Protistobacter heckmanni]|nr:hypothetical protein [Candidatus Protistobacter heckmanni]
MFDFGEFGFHHDENIDFKDKARRALEGVRAYNLISPDKLAIHLVHRASRVDINIEVFVEHTKDLVRLGLIAAGPKTPATAFSLPQNKPYYDRMRGIDLDEARNMKGKIQTLKTELVEVTTELEQLTIDQASKEAEKKSAEDAAKAAEQAAKEAPAHATTSAAPAVQESHEDEMTCLAKQILGG